MPDERTQLLPNGTASSSSPVRPRRPRWSLASEGDSLLRRMRSREGANAVEIGIQVPDGAQLAVLLYALNELSYPPTPVGPIRRRILRARREGMIEERLLESVEQLLDGEQRAIEEMDGTSGSEMDADTSRELFWKMWDAEDGKKVCAMELLLPPRAKTSSSFLSHPLVRYQLEQAWRHGILSTEQSGLMAKLRGAITPRRSHILHLAAVVVGVALTLAIALSPGDRISPYEPSTRVYPKPSALEIIWAIWTIDLASSLSRIPSLFVIPLVGSLVTIRHPPTTYSLLAFSVAFLIIMLLLPTFPSVPLLAPGSSMMPLSTLLLSTLNRSLRPLGILLPIMLGTMALFSWAINGDPFRGFSSLSSTLLFQTQRAMEEPVEEGVAPFQIRLSLFVTVCMLLLIALTLGFARSTLPQHSTLRTAGEGARRWKGDVMPEDKWEKEYGVVIGRRARKRFGEAVLFGLGLYKRWLISTHPYPDPTADRSGIAERGSGEEATLDPWIDVLCPINMLVLPFDSVLMLVKFIRWITRVQDLGAPENGVREVRQALAVVLMGPPCLLLSFLRI